MKAAPGEPVLISWADAVTLFHEFGHGLHGLNSNVTYPSLAGTQCRARLRRAAEPAERALAADAARCCRASPCTTRPASRCRTRWSTRSQTAQTFNQGFNTVEYLASAILDMKAHLAGATRRSMPRAFEARALAEIGMPPEIVMRHRLPHFAHMFSGEGYAAGYYNYIWADTLVADAAEASPRRRAASTTRRLAEAPATTTSSASATRSSRRGLPPLPRPRRQHRRADARPRLSGGEVTAATNSGLPAHGPSLVFECFSDLLACTAT